MSVIRIDLTNGSKKEVDAPDRFPMVFCKPLWDKAGGDLIVNIIGELKGAVYHTYSIARMNSDDLSTQVLVAATNNHTPGDVEIRGLVSYDHATNQVICYGLLDGPIRSSQRGAFFSVSLITGKLTEIMADTMPGRFDYGLAHGMATIGSQYVMMTRPGVVSPSPGSYCVDLKSKTWRLLPGLTSFIWPLSHDGLSVETPTNPASMIASPVSTTSSTTNVIPAAKATP